MAQKSRSAQPVVAKKIAAQAPNSSPDIQPSTKKIVVVQESAALDPGVALSIERPSIAQPDTTATNHPVDKQESAANTPASLHIDRGVVRIALGTNLTSIKLEASSPLYVKSVAQDLASERTSPLSFVKRGAHEVTCEQDSGDAEKMTLKLPLIVSTKDSSGTITYKGIRYRGSMIISDTLALTLINCLPVEEYLYGVVPLEMGKRPREEIEALKAQAVAARKNE